MSLHTPIGQVADLGPGDWGGEGERGHVAGGIVTDAGHTFHNNVVLHSITTHPLGPLLVPRPLGRGASLSWFFCSALL